MHTLTKQLCRLYVSVTTKHSCWAAVSFTSSLTLTALSVSKHVHDNKCNGKISRKQGSQMVGYRKYVLMKSHRTKLNFFPSGILPTRILSSKSLSAMIQFSWIPPSWILSSATLIYFMWLCPLLSTWFETGMGLLLSLFVCACVCMCVFIQKIACWWLECPQDSWPRTMSGSIPQESWSLPRGEWVVDTQRSMS